MEEAADEAALLRLVARQAAEYRDLTSEFFGRGRATAS